ncbi:hypothetical protein HU200_052400 [Digitaria exilis]|uniref:RNase H type-1 domain-containing protein n=1 Tax=Digitaria exilis TaxID=1010633 RepID=A0A835A8E2_9POAL|nr:hypothetical protein HU200_063410 [Digitaria exilis]KAF8668113.1 hypothetical protein HU200_052400 [Digitaria exilis]
MEERKERTNVWKPPSEGWIKVNVDGSFVEQTGEAGVGVIALIFQCASALEAEALSCLVWRDSVWLHSGRKNQSSWRWIANA